MNSTALCQADGDPSPRQLKCSRRALDRLDVTLEAFTTGDPAALKHAETLLDRLPDPAACDEAREVPEPDDSQRLVSVTELRLQLQRAVLRDDVGDYEGARRAALEIRDEAVQVGFEPLVAEATLVLARAESMLAQSDRALEHYQAAHDLALDSGHDTVALEAATDLIGLLGNDMGRPNDGLQWVPRARSLAERIDSPVDHARIETNVANIALRQGRFAEAERGYVRATRVLDATRHTNTRLKIIALTGRGNALMQLGRLEEAIEVLGRSSAMAREELAPGHISIAHAQGSLGVCYLHLQRLDEAQEAFETALRIFETNLGPHHMDVLGTRMNLAGVLAERGDLQGASAEYEQVLEAAEATLGRDHPQIAVILNNFADVEAAQGHHDVAQAMAARAITLVESSYGVEDVELFYPLLVMGRSLVQQEEFATALSYLDRALALRTSDATVVGVLCGRGKLRPLLLTHYRP